jgi:organic radical activating enzyme
MPKKQFVDKGIHIFSISKKNTNNNYWRPVRTPLLQATVQAVLTHPEWRLSLQTHRILGIK